MVILSYLNIDFKSVWNVFKKSVKSVQKNAIREQGQHCVGWDYLLWIRSLFKKLPSGIGKSGANSWDVLHMSAEKLLL